MVQRILKYILKLKFNCVTFMRKLQFNFFMKKQDKNFPKILVDSIEPTESCSVQPNSSKSSPKSIVSGLIVQRTSSSEAQSSEAGASKSQQSVYSMRESKTRALEKRFGAKALNEISLLNSGNSVVRDCTFQFKTNQLKKKDEIYLTLDYEATPVRGPLSDLCVKHESSVEPNQFQRELFRVNEPGSLNLVSRQIVTHYSPVPPLPFGSISSSLSIQPFTSFLSIFLFFYFCKEFLFNQPKNQSLSILHKTLKKFKNSKFKPV